MTTFHPANQRDSHQSAGFRIERVRPGRGLPGGEDLGLGPLGAFDHAYLKPGTVVAMHEHRDDEIISYIRRGAMHHIDTLSNRVPLTPTQFAVMNAGSGMMHEERVPEDGEDVELLQIFVRPYAEGLEPGFQSYEFDRTVSPDRWRLVFGPEDAGAPLTVRNQVWMYDIDVAGGRIEAPHRDGHVTWLYVFGGAVAVEGHALNQGDGVSFVGDGPAIEIQQPASLVCFVIDPDSEVSRSGTLSR